MRKFGAILITAVACAIPSEYTLGLTTRTDYRKTRGQLPLTVEKNPYYDNRTVYYLDVARLQPGDIILTRNRRDMHKKGRIQSTLIAIFGRSNFSHALICIHPPTLVEAIGTGVSTISIANAFYHEYRDVRVLRYADGKVAKRAATCAAQLLGMGYSVRMAINSVIPALRKDTKPKILTFCSALVAAAYRGGGAPEFASVDPYKTTPGALTRMTFLRDVTNDVAQSMLSPANIEEMTALDGDRIRSPFDGQAKALRMLHESVIREIEDFIIIWQLPIDIPSSFAESIQFLINALSWATDDDAQLKQDYLPTLRLIDDKLAHAFDTSGLLAMNREAEARDAATLANQYNESFKIKPDFNIGQTRALLAVTADQITSRGWVLEEPYRKPGLSAAWDRWCNLTEGSIAALRTREHVLTEVIKRFDAR